MKMQKYTIQNQLTVFKEELKEFYPDFEIESIAYLVLKKVLKLNRTQILLNKNKELENDEHGEITKILNELKKHKPIQYILGETEFYGLNFKMDERVLIPRQETEELVDWIITDNKNKEGIKIMDIGTGSGCIAICLAKKIPGSSIFGIDISDGALALAIENTLKNNTLVKFIKFDILEPKTQKFKKFDIIVSNPPYIAESETAELAKNVLLYEPGLALFVKDSNPLLFYEKIGDFAINHLNPHGKLYFEINERYGKKIIELLRNKGFADIQLKKDINGKDRMVRGIY